MRKRNFLLLLALPAILSITGCSVSSHSMKTPNYHIEFYKGDFTYSEQVTANATEVKVFGIDWRRLFKKEVGGLDSDLPKTGISDNLDQGSNLGVSYAAPYLPLAGTISIPVIPIIGENGKGAVSKYALYNLMKSNPGYDVVIYPQYHTVGKFFPLIYSKKTVTVTARLAKIN